jgi:hypothetical protein
MVRETIPMQIFCQSFKTRKVFRKGNNLEILDSFNFEVLGGELSHSL